VLTVPKCSIIIWFNLVLFLQLKQLLVMLKWH